MLAVRRDLCLNVRKRPPVASLTLIYAVALRQWGVYVLYDLDRYPPRNEVPWQVVLDTLHQALRQAESDHPAVS